MLHSEARLNSATRRALSVCLAANQEQVRAAQALRYRVFAEEMGAHLNGEPGLDQDEFDPWCDHLLVIDDETGEVVGTYRILTPHNAAHTGGLYSETEFDLTRLHHLRNQTIEVGRSCVHPDYRTGATIALLWNGLAEYMIRGGYEYLIGCASISMSDGGHMAASIFRDLAQTYLAPAEWRVFPKCPLPLEALDSTRTAEVPPLIRGYIRAGAYICGDPAWDPDFNTADLFIMMPMSRIHPRFYRHFVKDIAA
ncbi:GNAT family N-acetyltransferase [Burkholderiaceae bacterium DAT-1]|nr:GNAT family N-acetyltransferase [Burkholderiaceae bacterium DAT-1]